MDLPKGYRLLAMAPGVWVLVELYSAGRVVARYEDELDYEQVEKDAQTDSLIHLRMAVTELAGNFPPTRALVRHRLDRTREGTLLA